VRVEGHFGEGLAGSERIGAVLDALRASALGQLGPGAGGRGLQLPAGRTMTGVGDPLMSAGRASSAAAAAGLAVLLAGAGGAAAQAPQAVFVRGPGQPGVPFADSGDPEMIARLTQSGFDVQVFFHDDVAMVGATQAADLLFVSETTSSETVLGTFAGQGVDLRGLPVPITTTEPYLYDDLAMTGGDRTRTTPDPGNGGIDNGDYGNAPPFDSLVIVDPAHPMAAGLPAGPVQISDGTFVELGFGAIASLGAGAEVVATLDPATPWSQDQAPDPPLDQRAALFVYETGATMADGQPAPARRVALPGRFGAAGSFVEGGGWAVFDAGVEFANTFKVIEGGGVWSNPDDWKPVGLPFPEVDVYVRGSGAVAMDVAAPVVRDLRVEPGVTLDVPAGVLTVASGDVQGGLALSGGALATLGPLDAGGLVALSGGGSLRGTAGGPIRVDGELRVRTGTIEPVGAGRVDVAVTAGGVLDAEGLTFRRGVPAGLQVLGGAVARLRGSSFAEVAPGAGSRHLTIEAATLNVSAPGNAFGAVGGGQHNVRLADTDPATAGDVVLNLELRPGSGAGAGPLDEDEVGGAAINWVHAAPDTTAGTAVGFPQVAWDQQTFAVYATYAPFRDVDAAGTDRIYVLDPDGHGVDQGYSFDVPAAWGDLVGYPWWDQTAAGERILWVVTTTGRVLRFTDPGSGSGPVAPDPGYPTPPLTVGGQPVAFTTPPITDPSYLYAAGLAGASPRLLALDPADGSLLWSAPLSDPVTSELAWERHDGVTKVFCGGGAGAGGPTVLVDEDFDAGPGPFAYRDDTFRGTSGSGDDADGGTTFGQTGGGVFVLLGPTGTDFSGGWATTFTLPGPADVQIDLAYRLFLEAGHEPDEYAEALASIDGGLLGAPPSDFLDRLVGDGNGGPDMDTGWRQATFTVALGAGAHELILGGYQNQSTVSSEVSFMIFDDVRLEATGGAGRIYRVDTQTELVDAEDTSPAGAVVGAPFVTGQGGQGLFVADLAGRVHGLDSSAMAPLGGWPVAPASPAPVRGGVWFDFATEQVYWGDDAGRLHGARLDGALLGAFPVTPAGGAPIRRRPLVEGGVLWVGDTDGRLVAVDASTGVVVSPDYRFGAGVAVSDVATEFTFGRSMITNGAGKLLVVDVESDPTP